MSVQQHAPAAHYPRERPGTHFTEGWVGPRAGLDGRKISSPPGFDPGLIYKSLGVKGLNTSQKVVCNVRLLNVFKFTRQILIQLQARNFIEIRYADNSMNHADRYDSLLYVPLTSFVKRRYKCLPAPAPHCLLTQTHNLMTDGITMTWPYHKAEDRTP